MTEISADLKGIGKAPRHSNHCALPAETEKTAGAHPDKRPTVTSILDSAPIEQDADWCGAASSGILQ